MDYFKIPIFIPILAFFKKKSLSERDLSKLIKVSRSTLRKIYSNKSDNLTLHTLSNVSNYLERDIYVISFPRNYTPQTSTTHLNFLIARDGVSSWKIHLMDFVDEFRKSLDARMILMPPAKDLDLKVQALVASTVSYLCEENKLPKPLWVKSKKFFLNNPWFVSGIESLKASALLESPLAFRQNNIFVLNNFLMRA